MKEKVINDITMKQMEALMKKYRAKGLKPYLKGKGGGRVKIQFE